ncbi:MAG: MBL fold metallo-hydrolase [Candidatus Methanomethylophilaceae archaeon]|jgi:7,8-dihydropterin-6-yl-methyl-4-(beta-D-ribofuranosyl)aminobenzene 5'-phosphate synthase
MKAKLLCVYDEGALENTSLIGARGFSILVDIDGQRTLFDTGMRGRYLLHNMDQLRIDPESIDRVVLSHDHKANMNGLKGFLEARKDPLDVYAHPSCWRRKGMLGRSFFSGEISQKYVPHDITQTTQLSEHLSIIGPASLDANELFLVLKTRNGPVLLTACSHAGVPAVMTCLKESIGKQPFAIIGGLHIQKMKQREVNPIGAVLKDEYGSPKLYLNHCTGPTGVTCMRVIFNLDTVKEFYVGTELQFDI